MIFPLNSSENPFILMNQTIQKFTSRPPLLQSKPIICFQHKSRNTIVKSSNLKTHLTNPIIEQVFPKNNSRNEGRRGVFQDGSQHMLGLCGFGYWVQGFRCFPWLALNLHMVHNLKFHPSTLQLVQNSANLPMAAKPLYGILSDALYIGGAHRIPYISIGVILQVLSWGSLVLIPDAGEALPTLMACVLLGNLGASITEVAKDALVAEYGQKHKMGALQSYAFMASAAGGILGNLLGGLLLLKTQPKTMFFTFVSLLSLQLAFSLVTREDSLGLPRLRERKSILESIQTQSSELDVLIREDSIFRPLTWIVVSISMVPVLSGSIFCYQTQCLNLDPSVIGMSRVIGQLMLLCTIVLYDRFWKKVPLSKLIGTVQILYASSLLLDLVLVKQVNLKFGIPNEAFALCFSSLAETVAQFKILPFSVLFASLCPPGCEGSLTSFLASAMCLSSIISGFLGVGLASLIGITACDYSGLPLGIMIQFLAALVPLGWINHVPESQPIAEKERRRVRGRRTQRTRRVGRVVFDSVYVYRQGRD